MKKRVIRIILLVLAIMLAVINVAYAAPNDIYQLNGNEKLQSAGQYIAGWIKYAVIIAGVIVLMLKGIKFITAAPEGKADAKKELIPWAIGILIVFAFIPFLNWIIELTQSNINSIDHTQVGSINVTNLIKL